MTVAEDVVGALLATGVSIRGDVGERGPKGEQGDRGPQGPKGKDGRDGTDGKDGVGPDEKVKLSESDPKSGFLDDKLEAGRGVYLIKKRGSQGDKLVIEAPGSGISAGVSGGAGPAGPPGQGVPTGGTTGQVLAKASNANYDTEWATGGGGGSGLPPQWTDGGNGDVTAEAEPTFVPLTILASDDATEALILQGAPGSTAIATNLLQVLDDAGDPIMDIDADGGFLGYDFAAGQVRYEMVRQGRFLVNAPTGLAANTQILRAAIDNTNTFVVFSPASPQAATITALDPAAVVLRLEAAGSQTADLITAHDANWDEKFRVTKGGAVVTGQNAAPADAEFIAGQMGIWFDKTDGTATPMWKGKSADGTVVSGSLGGGSVTPATDPGDIADPTLATAEDVALAYNTLLANLRTAGLVA